MPRIELSAPRMRWIAPSLPTKLSRTALVFIALCAIVTIATLLISEPAVAGTVTVQVIDKEGRPVPDAVVLAVPSGKGEPATRLPTRVTIQQEKMRFVPAVALVTPHLSSSHEALLSRLVVRGGAVFVGCSSL